MAVVTHSRTITYASGNTTYTTDSNSYTAGAESNINQTFPIGTNVLVAFTLDLSQAKSIYIYSTTAATIKTNSSGAPDTTITLVEGQAKVWSSTDGAVNPFGTVDVTTGLYLTNAAETDLIISCLVDPTV
jgi:hypothetical protein